MRLSLASTRAHEQRAPCGGAGWEPRTPLDEAVEATPVGLGCLGRRPVRPPEQDGERRGPL